MAGRPKKENKRITKVIRISEENYKTLKELCGENTHDEFLGALIQFEQKVRRDGFWYESHGRLFKSISDARGWSIVKMTKEPGMPYINPGIYVRIGQDEEVVYTPEFNESMALKEDEEIEAISG